MAVAIDKEMRERAKAEGKYLFQVSLDPKYISEETKEKFSGKAPTAFSFAISGPLFPEQAVELWEMYVRWRDADLV